LLLTLALSLCFPSLCCDLSLPTPFLLQALTLSLSFGSGLLLLSLRPTALLLGFALRSLLSIQTLALGLGFGSALLLFRCPPLCLLSLRGCRVLLGPCYRRPHRGGGPWDGQLHLLYCLHLVDDASFERGFCPDGNRRHSWGWDCRHTSRRNYTEPQEYVRHLLPLLSSLAP